jgi:MFS family permease
VLSVVAILPVLRHLPAAKIEASAVAADTAAARLPMGRLVRYGLAGLLLGVSGGLLLPFQNLFFRQQFGLSDAAVGVVLAWVALGMGFGALLGSPVAARIGLRRGAALLRLGSVPAMLLMLTPMMLPAAVGLLLRGLFVAASFPLNDALVMQATPTRQRGMATSLTSLMWSGGWAISAALSGWIQLRWGFTPVILLTALFYVFSSLAIFTLPDDR